MAHPDWAALITRINSLTGLNLPLSAVRPAGGGCINRTALLEAGTRRYFVKYNAASRLDMYTAEAQGLSALAASGSIRVPTPICWDTTSDTAFLVLEYLELVPLRPDGYARLGAQLALLHRTTGSQYGWHRDNTIGTTPQLNTPSTDWVEFFRDRRLAVQLRLASEHGYTAVADRGARLLEQLDRFFIDHRPTASLLHGDLWSGNAAGLPDGQPVLFDPAVYYGDREADLAMTELFGGFPEEFYAGYVSAWPLAPGYVTRRALYNLYHVLNHLNLFGSGYLGQARRMIDELLAELR